MAGLTAHQPLPSICFGNEHFPSGVKADLRAIRLRLSTTDFVPIILFGGILSAMNLTQISIVLLVVATGACSSPRSASVPKLDESIVSGAAFAQSLPFTQAEFIDAVSAFIVKVTPDIKARGYAVVFMDIGPDSMEEQFPDIFRELAQKSSAGGVQVRGYSRMQEEGKAFRDRQTGESGVMFVVDGFAKKAEGRFLILGEWLESPPRARTGAHTVLLTMVKEGGVWKAL